MAYIAFPACDATEKNDISFYLVIGSAVPTSFVRWFIHRSCVGCGSEGEMSVEELEEEGDGE